MFTAIIHIPKICNKNVCENVCVYKIGSNKEYANKCL